ncbi:MAG TPA: radical SAM family heme chaperone HemW [Terriglobia bacterium]|nr:radical SAM family heme chaperone HemW [Terriglobia bacterium]
MNTLGIYVQIPFCASKCSFCNFSSGVARETAFGGYCKAIGQEIEWLTRPRPVPCSLFPVPCSLFPVPCVDTLYLGGGTPSILGKERLQGLIENLRRRFQFPNLPEITIEITPGSADRPLLEGLRRLGFNRLSIGAQSFDDGELRSVGRLHRASETVRQVSLARAVGFDNISLDLIGGLPHQTQDSWQRSLRSALSLDPQHVSVYLFEVDEKSRLGREVIEHGRRYHADAVPDDDFMAWAYEKARETLRGAGYSQYEISNFARPGYESRHNLKYWELKPYLGLGAGSHSFDGVHRWANEVSPEIYAAKIGRGESPIAETRTLSVNEQLEEFFFLGLRQRRGVDLAVAVKRWGSIARWSDKIARLEQEGWIERRDQSIHIPERAYLVSNEIFQEFLL